MSPKKTIYVREADQEVWEEAEKVAGESLSSVVVTALRAYLKARRPPDHPHQRIVVDLWDRDARHRQKAFNGRWLIAPGEELRSEHEGEDGRMAGLYYAVAATVKGHIVVYTLHKNDPQRWNWFAVYDSLAAAEAEGVPPDITALAAEEMGFPGVEELDI